MKKLLALWFVLLLVLAALPVTVLANSAEPPGLIIIATDLPQDAELTLECSGAETDPYYRSYRVNKLWESYWQFYYHWDLQENSQIFLSVESSQGSFRCAVPQDVMKGYRTLMTLDYTSQILSIGQAPWRQPLLTILRITLTLLIEGTVFWLLGFRGKRSWLVFLAVNLLTQGWLNIVINSYAFHGGYWVLSYILMEFGIFLAECIVLPLLIKEKRKLRSVLFALAANAASLIAGIFLIGHLPL